MSIDTNSAEYRLNHVESQLVKYQDLIHGQFEKNLLNLWDHYIDLNRKVDLTEKHLIYVADRGELIEKRLKDLDLIEKQVADLLKSNEEHIKKASNTSKGSPETRPAGDASTLRGSDNIEFATGNPLNQSPPTQSNPWARLMNGRGARVGTSSGGYKKTKAKKSKSKRRTRRTRRSRRR